MNTVAFVAPDGTIPGLFVSISNHADTIGGTEIPRPRRDGGDVSLHAAAESIRVAGIEVSADEIPRAKALVSQLDPVEAEKDLTAEDIFAGGLPSRRCLPARSWIS